MFALALLGCSPGAPEGAESPTAAAPTATPSVDATTSVTHASSASPASSGAAVPAAPGQWPIGFEWFDKPCGVEPKLDVYVGRSTCGPQDRVSTIEWQLADVVEGPALGLVIAEKTVQEKDVTHTLLITADAVWMRASRPTARVTGSTWMGLPARMSDGELEEAQRRAKLPTKPLLRTGAEWKAALIQSGPVPKAR